MHYRNMLQIKIKKKKKNTFKELLPANHQNQKRTSVISFLGQRNLEQAIWVSL